MIDEQTLHRDSVVIYRSFFDAIGGLDDSSIATIVKAIGKYALDGEKPEIDGVAMAIFSLIKPQIDANNRKYANGKKGASYGYRGGRIAKNITQDNPKITPIKPQDNPTETPSEPLNVECKMINVECKSNIEHSEDKSSSCSSPKQSGRKTRRITFGYDGDERIHGITQKDLDDWKTFYPAIDIEQELRNASNWLKGNPKNRKTDVLRFLTGWMQRTQDRAARVDRNCDNKHPDILKESPKFNSPNERGL